MPPEPTQPQDDTVAPVSEQQQTNPARAEVSEESKSPDYRTEDEAEAPGDSADDKKDEPIVSLSAPDDSSTSAQQVPAVEARAAIMDMAETVDAPALDAVPPNQLEEEAVGASQVPPGGPPFFLPGVVLALVSAGACLSLSMTSPVFLGLITTAILSLYWGFVNYRICKDRVPPPPNISPMRALAMSVFVNQFGPAHAMLFAHSILFQLILPVVKTLRPPDIVMGFSAVVGFVLVCLLVTLVVCLTVWWHVQLARFVYGNGTQKNVKAGVLAGLIFAGTGVWIVANLGKPEFYTLAPVLANLCYIPVFLIAKSMYKQGATKVELPAQPPPTPVDGSSSRLTLEWLLVLVYGVTVFCCAPSTETYSTLLFYFSGVPTFVWLAYLFRERKKIENLQLTGEATKLS